MDLFPPIPSWEAAHPLVVHFPVALLCVSPVFVVLALAWPGRFKELMTVAALVMVLAALGAVAAVMTGEYTKDAVEIGDARGTLREHVALARTARNLALGVAGLGVVVAVVAWIKPRIGLLARLTMGLLLLAGLGAAISYVARGAHAGGRLVHEHGVLAPMRGPVDFLPEG